MLLWYESLHEHFFGGPNLAEIATGRIKQESVMVPGKLSTEILLYALVVIGLNSLFLLSPPPVDDFYGYWVPLAEHVGIPRNYDSEEFAALAAQPAGLLQPECKRQSRPLTIWLAHVMAYPWAEFRFAVFSGIDVAYVLQNYVLLIGSVFLYARLCGRQCVPFWVMMGLVVPIVCNDLTKAFFWNNHQQMFAVFTPLFLIWMCVYLWERITVWKCVLVAAATGILFLGYGTWMLAFPLMIVITVLQFLQGRMGRHQLWPCLGAALLFAVPIMCWVGYITLRNGAFYSAEISLVDQFVWLPDALSQGLDHALRRCAEYAWNYGRTFRSWEVLPFVLAGAVLLVKNRAALSTLQTWSVVVFVMFAVFLYLLGYYRTRLTFSLVPPIMVWLAPPVAKWKYSAGVVALIDTAWVVFHVLKHGPYD